MFQPPFYRVGALGRSSFRLQTMRLTSKKQTNEGVFWDLRLQAKSRSKYTLVIHQNNHRRQKIKVSAILQYIGPLFIKNSKIRNSCNLLVGKGISNESHHNNSVLVCQSIRASRYRSTSDKKNRCLESSLKICRIARSQALGNVGGI